MSTLTRAEAARAAEDHARRLGHPGATTTRAEREEADEPQMQAGWTCYVDAGDFELVLFVADETGQVGAGA